MKINIVGFTSGQNQTKLSNKKGVMNFSIILPEILKELKHDIAIGDFEREADLYFVFVGRLNSLNTKFAIKTLDLIQKNKDKVILCFDDWNIKPGLQNMYRVVNRLFSFKTHPWIKQEELEKYFDVINDILNKKFNVLIPAFKDNNVEKLEIPAKKLYTVDPSIFCKYDSETIILNNKSFIPVYAGLARKDSFMAKIPEAEILRDKTEAEVFNDYKKRWFIINPPHYHEGSGWWRNRYVMANQANAILISKNNSYNVCNFENYKDLDYDEVKSLFKIQDEKYQNMIETRTEVFDKIKAIIETERVKLE